MSDYHQKIFDRALAAASQGHWDEALAYAKNTPPSWDVWQQFPQYQIPDEHVHKILDFLGSHPRHREHGLPGFLFEYGSNLPPKAGPEVLNRVADLGKEDHYVTENVTAHPNFKPDEKTAGVLGVSNFWKDYEKKVGPHHFATVQHLQTGQPVNEYTDHRGATGHSRDHEHLLPHFQEYGKRVQDQLLQMAREGGPVRNDGAPLHLRYYAGQPHIKLFRGINGDYADAIHHAAGTDEHGNVDRKVLNIPVSHLGSWTVDPDIAKRFAVLRHDLPGAQPNRPMVLEKWHPLKDVLHSGFTTVVAQQDHQHPHEQEVVVGHKQGKLKVPTSNIHHVIRTGGSDVVPEHILKRATVRETPPEKPPAANPMAKSVDIYDDSREPGDEMGIAQDMLGYLPDMDRAFEAARFLSGGAIIGLDLARRALYDQDGNVERAALQAYGLEVTETNLGALRAVQQIERLQRAEGLAPSAKSVESLVPEGRPYADAVRRAFADQMVFEVKLAGKHSKGSLIARDEQTHQSLLLKPGSSGPGPAAGAKEEKASQSRREAAFWHVVDRWGISDYYPRSEVAVIDGHEYAALQLLPWSYKTLERHRKEDPGFSQRLLKRFLHTGMLHRWAIADWVLGNPDSHGQNILANESNHIKLLDHGSAFAGNDFDPANDRNSFVPYYLRVWAPDNFNQLAPVERLKALPRVNARVAEDLKTWIQDLSPPELDHICQSYGINSQPSVSRLAKLQALITVLPADEAINRLWVST